MASLNQLIGAANKPPATGFPSLQNPVIDPTTSQLKSAGGRVSSLVTGCGASAPSTTSISIFWDGTNSSSVLRIYRDDQTVVGPFPGSQAITGLTANTKYFFYPYFDEATQRVLFVNTPTPSNGPFGTPPIAYTAQLIQVGISQIYAGRIALFSNLSDQGFSTPAAGSTAASAQGGGGGGGGSFKGRNLL